MVTNASNLGDDKCKVLPVWFAFTGCDTVSAFSGRGKKIVWDTWNAFPDITDILSSKYTYVVIFSCKGLSLVCIWMDMKHVYALHLGKLKLKYRKEIILIVGRHGKISVKIVARELW